jgi:hypothetical protein
MRGVAEPTGAEEPRKKIRHGEKKELESDVWIPRVTISNDVRIASIPSLSITPTKQKIGMDPFHYPRHEMGGSSRSRKLG